LKFTSCENSEWEVARQLCNWLIFNLPHLLQKAQKRPIFGEKQLVLGQKRGKNRGFPLLIRK